MTPVATIVPERLEAVRNLPLAPGGHGEPPPGQPPAAYCWVEEHNYLAGLPWGAGPANMSRVVHAFGQRFQDTTDQDGRDQLQAWGRANFARIAATKDDGHDAARGFMCANDAVRVFLPTWLEMIAGAPEAAAALRAHAPITDRGTARSGRDLIRTLRAGLNLPDYWAWRAKFREEFMRAYAAAMGENGGTGADATAATAATATAATAATAAAATAAAATAAATAATAAADATAATAAAATAAATAATAAADATAATAATDAADAATADATDATAAAAAAARWDAVYRAVKPVMLEFFNKRWAPATVPLKVASIDLLERMVAIGEQSA